MCGISGVVSFKGVPLSELKKATDIIRHRGPDDEGFVFWEDKASPPSILAGQDTPVSSVEKKPKWFPENSDWPTGAKVHIGLSHRRLSILDLSPMGHQPMSYKNGRYWITYNGEIYNYIELRRELSDLGHHFQSQSDTEAILAAYAQWGAECLARFNGMWSFAIYDTEEKTIFLARDRFGVKPLYYWLSSESDMFFGSEIKQFTVVNGWQAILNEQRAYDFLVWGITDHTNETLFDGVYHIPPGHYVLIDTKHEISHKHGRINTHQWYNLKPTHFSGSFDEAAERFRALLKESVNLRLRSDVPVGSCLSGGLDSSSIVCLMQKALKEQGADNRQKTFSALSRVETVNEQKWIETVVDHAQTEAHNTYPEMSDLFDKSKDITWHQDEPYGSTSLFAQWNVFKLAADNQVIVMLDGQGADEQLFGYHSAMGVRLASLLRGGRIPQLIRDIVSIHKIHGYSYTQMFKQTAATMLPLKLQTTLRNIVGKTIPDPDWLTLRNAKPSLPFQSQVKSIYDYCHAQMTSTNLQMLLHWEDRNSMAHSLESRVPFLDYRLVEFSMSLPDDYKTKDGITKRILREGMSGIIPDKIRDRMDKIGFSTPEELWIRSEMPDTFRQKIKESIKDTQGVLNLHCIDLLEDIIAGKKPFSFVVWRIISFAEWMQLFSVRVRE